MSSGFLRVLVIGLAIPMCAACSSREDPHGATRLSARVMDGATSANDPSVEEEEPGEATEPDVGMRDSRIEDGADCACDTLAKNDTAVREVGEADTGQLNEGG